jgi:uncharacterized protein YciI
MARTPALHVFFHRAGPRWQLGVPFPEQDGITDHIGFMRRMDEERRLVLGGPFDDELPERADGPVGIAIVEAADLPEAEALAQSDPSVQAGLLTVKVRPWGPRMGSGLRD